VKERELFINALQIEDPPGRSAYLDQACGGDAGLRERVEVLLKALAAAGSFMQEPVPASPQERGLRIEDGGSPTDAAAPSVFDPRSSILASSERPGAVIGPYKLLQQIGEGGMGTVFMAEQTQPVQRKVALKILKPGMDSRQVIGRFEAERQALALMDHPNIAKVIDAGTTNPVASGQWSVASEEKPDAASLATSHWPLATAGRPYFVMELVKGVPITKYCDDHHLTPKQRLELFVPVCQAVQHAHQKGIIHRDLKPSNVLVAEYDDKPVAKIIDFGVAKATGPKLTERTLFTEFGQIVGTLEYMSPEQAKLNALDIDTRSDIYALGVLLYELLTGTTPFEKKRLHAAALDEVLRIIREEEPPKPSTRISTMTKSSPHAPRVETESVTRSVTTTIDTIAAQRKSDPKRLSQLFRGELDWIVMKALEKDRNRRYETASAFAADVQRYLNDEPVLACPPSVVYQFRKFVRRHKAVTATTAMTLIVLLLGAAVLWRELRLRDAAKTAIEAAVERAEWLRGQERYEEALGVLTAANGQLEGRRLEALRERVRQQEKDIDMLQRLDAARLQPAAAVGLNWGDNQGSAKLHAEAFRWYGIDPAVLGPQEAARRVRESAICDRLIAGLQFWAGRAEESMGEDALAARTTADLADDDPWRRRLRAAVARGDQEDLQAMAEEEGLLSRSANDLTSLAYALEGNDSHNWPTTPERLFLIAQQRQPDNFDINSYLGFVLLHKKQPPDPVGAARFAQAALAIRPKSPTEWYNLAKALQMQGKLTEALAAYQKVMEFKPDDMLYAQHVAALFCEQGKQADAAEMYRRLITSFEERAGRDPASAGHLQGAAVSRIRLAELLSAMGAATQAEKLYERGLTDLSKTLEFAPQDAASHNSLAWLLATSPYPKLRDPSRAVRLAKRAVELEPRANRTWNTLAVAQYRAGDPKASIATFEKSMKLGSGGDSFDWFFLAMAHWQLGRKEEARKWYDKAVAWMDKHQPHNNEWRRFREEAAELLDVQKKK
jgi:serine/threonine protein kinase/predicted Zn-dependent protease